jgi:hypothetical protein
MSGMTLKIIFFRKNGLEEREMMKMSVAGVYIPPSGNTLSVQVL